jgi:hypothetical protein
MPAARATTRHIRLLAAVLATGIGCAAPALEGIPPQPGQWQPSGVFAPPAEKTASASRFLLLHMSGSGGMFGQGDLRSDLRDVAFWDDGRSGVASSHAGVFITADGGLTWRRIRQHERVAYPDEKGLQYHHIELAGPGDIWPAETKHPAIARHVWQDPADPSHAFAGVWNGFVAQRGMPRNGPALYGTVDGGDTWTIALRGALQINAIVGVPKGQLWAVGDRVGFAANDVVAILAPPGQHR